VRDQVVVDADRFAPSRREFLETLQDGPVVRLAPRFDLEPGRGRRSGVELVSGEFDLLPSFEVSRGVR
jgi:hypothetical protein